MRASCIRADSTPSLRISPSSRCTGGPNATARVSSATPTWWCAASPAGSPAAPIASMIEVFRAAVERSRGRVGCSNDPYTLTTGPRAPNPNWATSPTRRGGAAARSPPSSTAYWTGAFAMAMPNTPDRPAQQRVARTRPTAGEFRYAEQMSVGSLGRRAGGRGDGDRRRTPRRWRSAAGSRSRCRADLVERIAAQTGHRTQRTDPRAAATTRVETYTDHVDGCPLPRDDGPAGRPRLQGHRRCCSARAAWRWRWTATGSPTCTAC